MSKNVPEMGEAIARAIQLISAHEAVEGVSVVDVDPENGAVMVDVAIAPSLPNAWVADGVSPNGVRAVEVATLTFHSSFPLSAPYIELRADFDRSLAHVQPGPPTARPVPCIYEGDLNELLQLRGIAGIINQLVFWLEDAAFGRLINPEQGWEPVRRDTLDDFVVADAGRLRGLVDRKGGHRFFRFDYVQYEHSGSRRIEGEFGAEEVRFNVKNIGDLFKQKKPVGAWTRGHSLALVVWPGKSPSGEPYLDGQYRPETVSDVASLVERASAYGCAEQLNAALRWLETCVKGYSSAGTMPLAVILCVRRPWHLIGSDSCIELCPYIIDVSAGTLLPDGQATPVRPAGHRETISAQLLRRLSEAAPYGEAPPWALIGAGSLGSKIAQHLARGGRAPSTIIDKRNLSPHNAARHALLPEPPANPLRWSGNKALALSEAIGGLGQDCEGHAEDLIALVRDADRARKLLPKKLWAVVNTTASLAVREAIAASGTIVAPRVIEALLYAAGRVGVMSVEGPARNPDIGDLTAEAYTWISEDDGLRPLVFSEGDALSRQAIGEGCGSLTTVMSDGRLSILAASFSEALAHMQRDGLPAAGGRLLVGRLEDDGLGATWRERAVPPAHPIKVDGGSGWAVRLSARAHGKIVEEVARHPSVETGGVLVGRLSEVAKAFYIADVIEAPADSERTHGEFVLGVDGLTAQLATYTAKCGYSLYCLGTWHSHLRASGPSARDRATAIKIAAAQHLPACLLIHTPGGYRALLAAREGLTQPAVEASN